MGDSPPPRGNRRHSHLNLYLTKEDNVSSLSQLAFPSFRINSHRFCIPAQALANVQDTFTKYPETQRFLAPFTQFYIGLFDWIQQQLLEELQPSFRTEVQAFLRAHLSVGQYTIATTDDPDLGRRINQILKGQRL